MQYRFRIPLFSPFLSTPRRAFWLLSMCYLYQPHSEHSPNIAAKDWAAGLSLVHWMARLNAWSAPPRSSRKLFGIRDNIRLG